MKQLAGKLMNSKMTSKKAVNPEQLRQTVLTQRLAGLEGLKPTTTPTAEEPIT